MKSLNNMGLSICKRIDELDKKFDKRSASHQDVSSKVKMYQTYIRGLIAEIRIKESIGRIGGIGKKR